MYLLFHALYQSYFSPERAYHKADVVHEQFLLSIAILFKNNFDDPLHTELQLPIKANHVSMASQLYVTHVPKQPR